MIYMYINGILLYLIGVLAYRQYKEYLPKAVRNNIYPIQIGVVLTAVYLIGSPVRLTSTTLSGKENFSTERTVIPQRVAADKQPETSDLKAEFEKLKQQSKETQDEIN